MRLKSIGRIVNFALRPAALEIRKRHEVRPWTIHHNVPSLPASFFVECRVLANRLDLLDIIPKTAVVAEIGVSDGDFSAEIIARTQPAILHLIDAWDSDRFAAGLARVHSRFHTDISCGSVVVHQGLSVDVLPTLAAKSFDWMYIDTTHAYVETIQELHLCAGLVKDGGRIAGHDFCIGDPYSARPYGVIRAVYEFCLASGWAFEFITLDGNGYFSFCLKHH
jgi:hypothetical protein